jgi:hypothetical protein
VKAFERHLQGFRDLAQWPVVASGAAPFVAAFSGVSPPWPDGVAAVTGVIELVVILLAFQGLQDRRRASAVVLWVSAAVFLAGLLAYLWLFSEFTYVVPGEGRRYAKGLACTPEASAVFKARCPDLGEAELSTASWDAWRLWTRSSISQVRLLLLASWLVLFIALASLVSAFLTTQSRKRRRPAARASHA